MPFENPQGTVNTPAPVHPYFNSNKKDGNVYYDKGSPINPNQKAGGYAVKEVGCGNTSLSAEEMAAIGYGPKDTTSSESIISGRPTRNTERQAGKPGTKNTNTSGRENARVRQTGY